MLDSRITQRRPSPPSTGGRDRSEWVVAIRRNGWSRSIGIAGRDQPVRAGRFFFDLGVTSFLIGMVDRPSPPGLPGA
jgi:hypothetical protein